jgi:hypothetical protein
MPNTAISLGTTVEALRAMQADAQLDYVKAYFSSYTGKMTSIEDIYMAILWPKAVGKDDKYVLFDNSKDSSRFTQKAYEQNKALDNNKDGKITKQEGAAGVRRRYQQGLLPGNFG